MNRRDFLTTVAGGAVIAAAAPAAFAKTMAMLAASVSDSVAAESAAQA